MLLLLLSCLLPAAQGQNCLQCWPELPALMDYDLQILWGTPGPPTDLSQSIHSLFQEKRVFPHPWYLGQDHLEEAAAKLFSHIATAIQKLRDDKQQFMNEVKTQKRLFSEKLSQRSEDLKKKDLYKMEVVDCSSCKKHVLICKDPTICPADTQRTFLWAVILSIVLSLVIMAVGG
ncbi:testis-expressed protein 51 [Sorex fumeus]|uniref:testis-expressed protein 51 n=1 Tax=Sorex fumeus TaxID=62283 RepID=UPI0024ADE75C|nr:testis-expressed protein 51 [Sorex fumeus]